MRLSAIRLSGFKSFVDPTTLRLPGSLTAIVGPNGCGKSNVIDAVRWVLGESSAKALRGEALEDVIFNGARSRKPVGRAAIELIFDNSDGTLGGQYASFAEIAVKRELVRDGSSNYFLNGSRCRRRDITDLFLGTGLGGRNSYAIIEQGTISRLIEARPEDVRLIIEEAAGISKYKERRRETESRIRHTRENLERLEDLRSELEERLNRLRRQADNAEKYKRYKTEERQLKAELLALRYRELASETEQRRVELKKAEAAAAGARERLADLIGDAEALRRTQEQAAEVAQNAQGEFYGAEAEVVRAEQALAHARELRQMREQERRAAEAQYRDLQARREDERSQVTRLESEIGEMEARLAEAGRVYEEADRAAQAADAELEQAQQAWEDINRRSQQPRTQAEGERARVEALERSVQALDKRAGRLAEERLRLEQAQPETATSDTEAEERELAEGIAEMGEDLRASLARHARLRDERGELDGALHEVRQSLQSNRGRLSSLEALAQSAARQDDEAMGRWLQAQGLVDAPRLSQHLTVEAGWERAVESALGGYLHALCLADLQQRIPGLNDWPEATLALVDAAADARTRTTEAPAGTASLAEHVQGPGAVLALLANVFAVEDVPQALDAMAALQPGQLLVTKEGCCLGKGTLYWPNFNDSDDGVLEREKAMQALRETLEGLETHSAELEARQGEVVQALSAAEHERTELEGRLEKARGRHNEVAAERRAQAARQAQARERGREVAKELEEIDAQTRQDRAELEAARSRLESARDQARRLEEESGGVRQRLTQAREQAASRRRERDRRGNERQKLELELAGERASLTAARRAIEELAGRIEQARESQRELADSDEEAAQPIAACERALAQAQEKCDGARQALQTARERHGEVQSRVESHRERVQAAEAERERAQDALQQARIQNETQAVRLQGVADQIAEAGFRPADLLDQLNDEASIAVWEDKIERMERRIQRLGPINLAAIQEYEEQAERSEYLNAQHADLTEALNTLEQAIARIDRETRSRFRDTFEKVDGGFRSLFPRLFGGGEAYLELTGDDLLDTGIRVMARPPGKRNSSIQLLSGGEKALTAVSLVFALFELNPAPFCMLDEVDAPLDDANVGRFCELVRGMSDRVQFIVITHNKITMELAHQLHGVTMHEPGVSRLVSVDVEEAVAMAGA